MTKQLCLILHIKRYFLIVQDLNLKPLSFRLDHNFLAAHHDSAHIQLEPTLSLFVKFEHASGQPCSFCQLCHSLSLQQQNVIDSLLEDILGVKQLLDGFLGGSFFHKECWIIDPINIAPKENRSTACDSLSIVSCSHMVQEVQFL